ncbi:MAG: vanadium-dependent haloperoxidase [Fimbriimonadaceae bacterium]|nr:vanadium-dependent haloperoxidase [Fimbriimonadaceae bacterium]
MSHLRTHQLSRRQMLAALSVPLFVPLVGCGGGGSSLVTGPATRSISYFWTGVLMETLSTARLGPPQTARAIAMVATAAFDAWACYTPQAVCTLLGGQIRRPAIEHTDENKEVAISYAVYRVLADLFPALTTNFDAHMASRGLDPMNTSTDTTTAIGVGNRVAEVFLDYRHNDGSNQLNGYADTTGYTPVNTPDNVVDPSKWQQLRFANGATPGFVAPHWGNVIPFALTSPSSLRPPAPPEFGSPTYLAQMQEIIDLTANLDDRKKVIAEYWADGPATVLPPGHWQLFGRVISERDRHTLDQDVQMFFMLGNAVFDAGIACWDCKVHFNISRPITAIRHFKAGEQVVSFGGPGVGMVMADGATWHPYQSVNFVSPPFAEYTSGHSTFSAASAEVLKRFTGSDAFGHSATIAPGSSGFETTVPAEPVTLSWNTFSDAADEAGASRLYGGIHFRPGDLEGRRCGRQVGESVYNVAMSYITGSAPSRRP